MSPEQRQRLKNKISVIIVMNRFDTNVISEEIAEKILQEIEKENKKAKAKLKEIQPGLYEVEEER